MIAKVIPLHSIKTKLVCSACGAAGEGSCGCGVAYVSPGARAEEAVKANPEKSDRAIADDIGVSHQTVMRERKKATGPHGPVEKRVGKDGKSRKPPKRGTGKTAEKYQQTRSAVRDSMTAGQAVNTKAVAAEQGVSVDTVERAALAEQARIDLLEELAIDPATLSLSAQAKLEIAGRMMERKLSAEHAARMAQIDEEVRQKVLAGTKARLERLNAMEAKATDAEALYRKWADQLTPTFTEPEFFVVLRALDPAIQHQLAKPNPERIKLMNDATALMNDKRERLTLKKIR